MISFGGGRIKYYFYLEIIDNLFDFNKNLYDFYVLFFAFFFFGLSFFQFLLSKQKNGRLQKKRTTDFINLTKTRILVNAI
mgnify:CR=1 FL=1